MGDQTKGNNSQSLTSRDPSESKKWNRLETQRLKGPSHVLIFMGPTSGEQCA